MPVPAIFYGHCCEWPVKLIHQVMRFYHMTFQNCHIAAISERNRQVWPHQSVAKIACDFRWRSNSPRSANKIARCVAGFTVVVIENANIFLLVWTHVKRYGVKWVHCCKVCGLTVCNVFISALKLCQFLFTVCVFVRGCAFSYFLSLPKVGVPAFDRGICSHFFPPAFWFWLFIRRLLTGYHFPLM